MSGSYKCDTASTDINARLQHGKFRNIVTVSKDDKFADFNCANVVYGGSDAACIQAVLDTVPSNTLINFNAGVYNIDGIVTQTGKSFTLKGDDGVVFNLSGAGDDTPALQFYGTFVLSTTLVSDVVVGGDDLVLTDITNVQVGDLIKIYNTDIWTTTYNNYTGELYEVKYINNVTKAITLSQGLIRSYLASNTTVKIYRPVQINFENLIINGTGATDNVYGMALKYLSNSHIHKCTLTKHGRRTIMLLTCYNVDISLCNISDARFWDSIIGQSGYGIGIADASTFINIHHNRIENCRHCVMGGTTNFEGLNRGILITDNFLAGGDVETADVIDSHPSTIDYTVTNNKIYPRGHYAFWDGTAFSIFSNNYVCGGGGVENRNIVPNCTKIISNNTIVSSNGLSLYRPSLGGTIDTLLITGNHLCDGGQGIQLHDEYYKSVVINSNVLKNCTENGISVVQYAGSIPTLIKICNNVITAVDKNGIYIKRSTTADTLNAEIIGNTIENVGLGGNYHGLYLVDIDGAFIAANTIRGSYNAVTEISVLGGANNNKILYNNISNFTNLGIVKIGTGTKIENNYGYPTENTGSATIPTSQTSVTVTHGLAATPTNVSITPKGNVGSCWWDTPTSTTFIIHCSAALVADIEVNWTAIV